MARAAALLGLALASCSMREQPPEGAHGNEIYRMQNCANCHGPTGAGGSLGPALAGLEKYWDADELAEYFVDPKAFEERDERLRELKSSHSGTMTSYANLSEDQRLTLARWLLAGGLSSGG